MKRILIPALFGLIGFGILISLGNWQLNRLAWKEGELAAIESKISAAPLPLAEIAEPVGDRYSPVLISGRTTGDELLALVSVKQVGAGYRVISAFETDEGRRVLLDEGFIRSTERDVARPAVSMQVVGNLLAPDEVDSFTPDPDLANGLIFARDVPLMAEALGTEPILVVARTVSGTDPRATPLPVTSEGIPNNHLGYAVQWFGLAAVWAGMTAFYIWRITRRGEGTGL